MNSEQSWAQSLINWDRNYATPDCPYCQGTGMADTHNACGFCDDKAEKREG